MSDVLSQPQYLHPNGFGNAPTTSSDMGPANPAAQPQSIATKFRNGHLNLDNFSPVNQNGSFEFDKVLKSGLVQKRTRKTKQWRTFYVVLRPNLLSIYKSSSEEKLLKKISLSDLTAVAYVKDPKGKRKHLFGLYSPSRNFHLQARSDEEAREWVTLIKQEARIDEYENEVLYGSPINNELNPDNVNFPSPLGDSNVVLEGERYASSSPEPFEPPVGRPTSTTTSTMATTKDGIKFPSTMRKASGTDFEYSGNEMGSYSEDLSDGTPGNSYQPTTSFGSFLEKTSPKIPQQPETDPIMTATAATNNQNNATNPTTLSKPTPYSASSDRVIQHGYLLCLKSRRGVKQWKRLWVVLRSTSLTFYKSEEEYAALRIIPLSSVISAGEIDSMSKSKRHCMQIIAEEKSYRFCAPDEDALARWLGAVKSRLVGRRREMDR